MDQLGAPGAQTRSDKRSDPIGPMPTANGFRRDKHCSNVRSCDHCNVIHVKDTNSAVALLVKPPIGTENTRRYFNENIYVSLLPIKVKTNSR